MSYCSAIVNNLIKTAWTSLSAKGKQTYQSVGRGSEGFQRGIKTWIDVFVILMCFWCDMHTYVKLYILRWCSSLHVSYIPVSKRNTSVLHAL